jgi:hypothetical protein
MAGEVASSRMPAQFDANILFEISFITFGSVYIVCIGVDRRIYRLLWIALSNKLPAFLCEGKQVAKPGEY